LLAFTDDDCAPDPGWLNAFAGCLAPGAGRAAGGRTINALPANPYSAASQGLVDYLYSHFNRDPARARFLTSNNLAVPARDFRALGGFDERFTLAAGEDRDFCARWLCSGRQMVYLPAARVYHAHPLSPRTFFRQQFNYGRGAFYFHRLRQAGESRREPPAFYLKLLSHPFSAGSRRARDAGQALLMAFSQLAIAAGYARAAWFDRKLDITTQG
jgi:GT2 family glycosyltransferase